MFIPYAEFIKSLSPEMLKTTPAGQPPPGIQPNFTNPQTRVPKILGVCITFFTLTCICFSIRLYTKIFIVKKLKWDDVTCSLGFMCSIVYFVGLVLSCVSGGVGKHMWDLHLNQVFNKSNIFQSYIGTVIVTPALGLIKISLFIQYYLLFRVMRYVRISVYIGATVSVIFYISITITLFILVSPWPGESFTDDFLSSHFSKNQIFSIPTGVINVVVDWTLLILPMPAVWSLNLSRGRKLGVMLVFMTGGFAAIASIVGVYYRYKLENDLSDSMWNVGYHYLWSQIEMFAGVTASSMPTVRQFFVHHNFSLKLWRSTLRPGLSHLRSLSMRPARDKIPEPNSDFEKWGYRSTAQGENTTVCESNNTDASERGENPKIEKSNSDCIQLIESTSVILQSMEDV